MLREHEMGDSYRPQHRERDRPPPLADRMTFTHGGDGRSSGGPPRQHRRADDNRQFTFESNHPAPQFPPAGPANAGSRGPPTGPRRRPRDNGRRPDQGGRNNANGFRRGGGFRKAAPHERALLQQRDDGIEHTMGVSDGPNRFKDLADLSDDEEADMEHSTDEDAASGPQDDSRRKIARTAEGKGADGDSVPKWSNPDFYTALPPPSETTGKHIDVVNLIRKAKNAPAEGGDLNNAVAANDDFISFGFDDDKASEISEISESSERSKHYGLGGEEVLRPLPRVSNRERPMGGAMNEVGLDYIDDSALPSQNSHLHFDNDSRPYAKPNKKRKPMGAGPPILDDWLASPRYSSTPWLHGTTPYDHLMKMPEKLLHNEILDFYDFVAPKTYEHALRNDLVNRVNNVLGPRRLPQDNGRILCFGSFPAGLYLPTADMDLVYTSDRHLNGGPPVLDLSRKTAHKKMMWDIAHLIERARMCSGRPIVIPMAKVPLIKFVDRVTGLQVDVSFENLSGVQAQATFHEWKERFPDMVYLVALVKQFLVMRGLNEVHSGGIGGFSIICLVVSYLHHSQKYENLGACFVGFLDHYGNKFDLATQRLQMQPFEIVKKTRYGIDDREEKVDGLSIQDPNRPENNISGGSHKAKLVFKAFAIAHQTLEDRMAAARAGQNIGPSLLECILGGNYSSYEQQRRRMKSL